MSESETVHWKELDKAIKRRYIVKWDKCAICGRYAETVLIGGFRICGSNECFAKFITLLAEDIRRWADAYS